MNGNFIKVVQPPLPKDSGTLLKFNLDFTRIV